MCSMPGHDCGGRLWGGSVGCGTTRGHGSEGRTPGCDCEGGRRGGEGRATHLGSLLPGCDCEGAEEEEGREGHRVAWLAPTCWVLLSMDHNAKQVGA